MPRPIGFSTGSLNGPDFAGALAGLADTEATAVELSALREQFRAGSGRMEPAVSPP